MICALSKAPLDAASCCSVCSCLAVRGVRCADRAVHGALGASDFPPINAPFPLTADVCGRPVSAREVLYRWGSQNSAHAIQTTAQYLSTQKLKVHLLDTASVVRILCRGSCGTHIAPPPLPLSAAAVVCGRCFAGSPSNKTSLLPTRCKKRSAAVNGQLRGANLNVVDNSRGVPSWVVLVAYAPCATSTARRERTAV
jgi:hypothetical protein